MFASKKDFNELFLRFRDLEIKVDVKLEHDKSIETKVDGLHLTFDKHDEREMKKYDSINESIRILAKNQNLFMGAIILFQILISTGMIKIN